MSRAKQIPSLTQPLKTPPVSTMDIYHWLVRPLLFQLDPETAHHAAHLAARALAPVWPILSGLLTFRSPELQVTMAGIPLANPVGLAAGFDKNGALVEVLGYFGFGYAEIGSVTACASPGNPRPRLFRLPADQALVNRMGLNGDGAEVIARRLAASRFSIPVGLNIAKTNDPAITGDRAVQDILTSFAHVKDLPVSYITVNASCPNTREGRLAEKGELSAVFAEMQKENRRGLPIFVKLSPDSSAELLGDIVEAAHRFGLAGFVCGNTTTASRSLKTSPAEIERIGPGGLSGPPLKDPALSLVRRVYRLKGKDQIIIAVGGISSGADAYEFILNGATAVQLYTALVYRGPSLPQAICQELVQLLQRDGLTLAQAVGAALP